MSWFRHPSARLSSLLLLIMLLASAFSSAQPDSIATGSDSARVEVPLGGNAWVVVPGLHAPEVTDSGLSDWSDAEAVCRAYVRVNGAGSFRLSLRFASLLAPSRVRVGILGRDVAVDCHPGAGDAVAVGEWRTGHAGYLTIEIQGISRSGNTFGVLRSLLLEGDVVRTSSFVRNDDGNFFYWGRRGPSVHLNYEVPPELKIEWLYNEVTIPRGSDVIGSFFMANGFSVGYFGMQVNSEEERRILFSVWSPFATDDPRAIPPDQRIVLVRKGVDVVAGEFGDEGSGGQSYLKFPWQADSTYRFLLSAESGADSQTTYTAYFFAPERRRWSIIASFRRPRSAPFLERIHSFLENFIPETGIVERSGEYGNQWVRDDAGVWHEVTRARFSADNTARVDFRRDYAGGERRGRFFLRNCGFFDDATAIGATFERPASGRPPEVDLSRLP